MYLCIHHAGEKSYYDIENPIVRDTIIQRTKQDRKVYSLTISDNKSLLKKSRKVLTKCRYLQIHEIYT